MIIVSFGYNEDYLFTGDAQELGVLGNLRRVEEVTIDNKKCFKVNGNNNISVRFIDDFTLILGLDTQHPLAESAEKLSSKVKDLEVLLKREQVYAKHLLEAKLLNISEETWRKQIDSCSSYNLSELKPKSE